MTFHIFKLIFQKHNFIFKIFFSSFFSDWTSWIFIIVSSIYLSCETFQLSVSVVISEIKKWDGTGHPGIRSDTANHTYRPDTTSDGTIENQQIPGTVVKNLREILSFLSKSNPARWLVKHLRGPNHFSKCALLIGSDFGDSRSPRDILKKNFLASEFEKIFLNSY